MEEARHMVFSVHRTGILASQLGSRMLDSFMALRTIVSIGQIGERNFCLECKVTKEKKMM